MVVREILLVQTPAEAVIIIRLLRLLQFSPHLRSPVYQSVLYEKWQPFRFQKRHLNV